MEGLRAMRRQDAARRRHAKLSIPKLIEVYAHGGDAKQAIPFVHIDLGGSACEEGDWQHGRPTAASLVTLTARWAIDDAPI